MFTQYAIHGLAVVGGLGLAVGVRIARQTPTHREGWHWLANAGPQALREGDGGDGGDGDGEPDMYVNVYVNIIESAGFGFVGFIGNPWNPWDPRRVPTIKYKKD